MANLLIVDDDEDFAGAARMMLQARGYDVAMEHDTAQVLPRLDQKLPDALLLDVMFPENPRAGFELAEAVRQRYPDLPIVILTAVNAYFPLGFGSQEARAARPPVTEFLEKPVDFRALSNKLDRLLHRPTFAVDENG